MSWNVPSKNCNVSYAFNAFTQKHADIWQMLHRASELIWRVLLFTCCKVLLCSVQCAECREEKQNISCQTWTKLEKEKGVQNQIILCFLWRQVLVRLTAGDKITKHWPKLGGRGAVGSTLLVSLISNKPAKLRRCVSRIHFGKKHFGQLFWTLSKPCGCLTSRASSDGGDLTWGQTTSVLHSSERRGTSGFDILTVKLSVSATSSQQVSLMSGLNQIIWKLPRKFMFFCATLIRRISSHRMFKTVDKSVLLLSGKCTVCVNSWDSLAIVHIGNWMELISNFLAFTSYILHFPNCSMF